MWRAKEPSLFKGYECRAYVKICSPSPVMVTSTYDCIIIEWDNKHTTKQTNTYWLIIIKCVNLEWRTIDVLIWLVLNLSFYLILYTTEYNFLQTTYYKNYKMWFTKIFILAIVNDKKSYKCCMFIHPIIQSSSPYCWLSNVLPSFNVWDTVDTAFKTTNQSTNQSIRIIISTYIWAYYCIS